jgi:hypothetical protein
MKPPALPGVISLLSNLIEEGELTNQVLEVVLSTDGSVELIRFKMPPS